MTAMVTSIFGFILISAHLLYDAANALVSSNSGCEPTTFLILGGSGRIGTAAATHLLLRKKGAKIILAGRDHQRGQLAVAEVLREYSIRKRPSLQDDRLSSRVSFSCFDWKDEASLQTATSKCDCVIHTAGPYLNEKPLPLLAAITSQKCRAYVDVSDPLDFLDESLSMSQAAVDSGTSALIAAGAFPGMSNVLAIEGASKLNPNENVKDVRFNYFTAGLGGSGDINLYITNIGFGEPMVQRDNGEEISFRDLSGKLLGKVDFFLDEGQLESAGQLPNECSNEAAKSQIGTQTVFSWPFPEAATVPRELNASGSSSSAMGTAPDVWNTMLGVLVSIVPRRLWRNEKFSKFMADFSQPLVKATDNLLQRTSVDGVGETHAMRVDIIGEEGTCVSTIQAHESFRWCVGQSCAEFALDLLDNPLPGVALTEQRYRDENRRKVVIEKLTTTHGTIAYTGARRMKCAPPPTEIDAALENARISQSRTRLELNK